MNIKQPHGISGLASKESQASTTAQRSKSNPKFPSRYFAWLYFLKRKELGTRAFTSQIHRTRDGLAHLEISAFLAAKGISYAGAILNIPKYVQPTLANCGHRSALKLEPNDLVLLATRPPLDDPRPAGKGRRERRRVDRSETPLERELFSALLPFFARCDRGTIELADNLTCDNRFAARFRKIKFQENQGGYVRQTKSWKHEEFKQGRLGVGYLVVVPPTRESRFRIIALFSSGGTETLWTALLVAREHRDLLERALLVEEPVLWQIPFLWPDIAPEFLCLPPGCLNHPKFPASLLWTFKKRIDGAPLR